MLGTKRRGRAFTARDSDDGGRGLFQIGAASWDRCCAPPSRYPPWTAPTRTAHGSPPPRPNPASPRWAVTCLGLLAYNIDRRTTACARSWPVRRARPSIPTCRISHAIIDPRPRCGARLPLWRADADLPPTSRRQRRPPAHRRSGAVRGAAYVELCRRLTRQAAPQQLP
jgi:hypothetical protein